MEAAKSRHAQHFGEASGVASQSPAGTQGRPNGGVVADIRYTRQLWAKQGSSKTQFNVRPTVLMSPHCWMLKSGRETLRVFEKGDPHQVHLHTLVCAHLGKQELPHAVTPTWRCVDVHLDGPACRDEHEASVKMYTHTSLAVFESPRNTASLITVVKQQRSEPGADAQVVC